MGKRPEEKKFNNKNLLAFQKQEIARFKRLNKTKVLKTRPSLLGKVFVVNPARAEAIG